MSMQNPRQTSHRAATDLDTKVSRSANRVKKKKKPYKNPTVTIDKHCTNNSYIPSGHAHDCKGDKHVIIR